MLRATDVFILHCGQYTVLHVKVVNVTSVVFCRLLVAQRGADGAGSVLLHQEASIALSGRQSCNTKSRSSVSESWVFTYQAENWMWTILILSNLELITKFVFSK